MKKIRLIVITLSVMLLSAIITNGCASAGYYQDQAVQSARAFLLEEMPEIPLMEQDYIKFNRPFKTVQIIIQSHAGIDKQRGGNPLEIQRVGQMVFKAALHKTNGGLRLIQIQLRSVLFGCQYTIH